ncbi:MAG TPA: IS110 family transposase [Acidothermaceae bacterium]
MGAVVIGMDPHKRTATIEVMDGDETILGGGRYATDVAGYQAMLAFGQQFVDRTWAIEGCNGIGKHIADRLLADGEQVVDVPPKLSARTRVFATGQGRKTDATDAHSVALVGTRMSGLRPVVADEELAVLRLLADRRRSLGQDHTRMVAQLHRILLELIPGGAKKQLSAAQAKVLLSKVRPRDTAGKTRKRVCAELVADLERIHERTKAADKELKALLVATGTTLMTLHGIGPSGAARLLVEVGDITRFPTRAHFASWTGTAPIDASSGDHVRHRLSRGGNRQINRTLHIMAVAQLRNPTKGRAYYNRKKVDGKAPMEAMRCLKRRLSDVVYRQLLADAIRPSKAGPGGHSGAALNSSAVDSNPDIDASKKSLPGPANTHVTRAKSPRPDRSSTRSRRPATAPARSRRQAQSA